MPKPLVIAHRGASGYLPEHTLPGYLVAIEQGADFIEPDLVMTSDGHLVARHENEISETTDVASHAEFATRRRTKVVDGRTISGWFTEDFTLAELRHLRARERLPLLRPQGARFDGQFRIPTFQEILELLDTVNQQRRTRGEAPVGVYPETKHPSYFAAIGLALEAPLLDALRSCAPETPVFIQSFEIDNLRALRQRTNHPLVLLIEQQGAPWDLLSTGDSRTYRDLLTPEQLRHIADFASAIGVHKHLVCPLDANGALAKPTSLVADAHAEGLAVHAWTFRIENAFVPPALRCGTSDSGRGDLQAEIRFHLDAGIDAFFTDNADVGRVAAGEPG